MGAGETTGEGEGKREGGVDMRFRDVDGWDIHWCFVEESGAFRMWFFALGFV